MLFAWISWVYSRPLLLRAILVYYTHTLSLSQVPVLTVSYNFFSVAQAYIYYKDLHYQCPLSLSLSFSLSGAIPRYIRERYETVGWQRSFEGVKELQSLNSELFRPMMSFLWLSLLIWNGRWGSCFETSGDMCFLVQVPLRNPSEYCWEFLLLENSTFWLLLL